MGTIDSIFIIILSVFFSGFFSGSEAALISCSKVKLHSMAKGGSWRAAIAQRLIESPERLFSVVLVGNNLVNVICTVTATALAIRFYGESGAILSTLVVTPLILIFGEVIPKAVYLYHADRFSIAVAPYVKMMFYLLWPVVMPVTGIARLIAGRSADEERKMNLIATREELIYLYSRGRGEGETEKRETEIIDRVFNFGVMRVGDLMIPMEKVETYPVSSSVDEVRSRADVSSFSRYPLVSPATGRVVGVISLFDLLGLDGGERLSSVMHRPFTASADEPAERLLIRMKDDPLHFAVVMGRDGEAQGIVTLEDILENIVGDIATGH